jgi:hypothetical protein
MGYIDSAQLKKLGQPLIKTEYGKYIDRLAEGGRVDGEY